MKTKVISPIGPPANRRLRGLYKHGHASRHGRAPEYVSWRGMVNRCNPNNPTYASRRGIGICDRWRRSFHAFLEDMGTKPTPRHTIDRIDNDRGYNCGKCDDCKRRGEPPNCRWATYKQQGRNTTNNRHVTFRGETHCLAEWAEILNISTSILISRINRYGWSVERAFTTPPRRY